MTPEQWQQVERAFERAVKLNDAQRADFVDEFAARDAALGQKLRDLLQADEIDMDLKAPVAASVSRMTRDTPDPWVGKTIGAWSIVRRLAAGGMGTVFLAERDDDQYQQHAAIKIMTAQLLAPDAIVRFRAERQILATLNHPYIAKLIDGGSTEEKLPFLVMEYVDGLPIDAFCDQRRLTIHERLDLFLKVCEAVDYAHRNLVVHRDLKPNNILVNTEGEPRLLDFGIAKLLEGGDVGQTVAMTRHGSQIMTPEYASPEQVLGLPVTVATDVYALGVLLYRLLCGHHPYAEQLTTSVATERAICEFDPRPPSTRPAKTTLEEPSQDANDLCDARRTTLAKLVRELRGDLDKLVLKAMRKEPQHRYRSVGELIGDIERYRQKLPVHAHPPSVRYRLGKFIRRHAMGVALSTAASLAFVALIGFYTVRVTLERDRAQLEAAKASQVAQFVSGLFSTANPDQSLGEIVTARSLLDQGVLRLGELDDQPEVQATMQDVMGSAYRGLGLFDRAKTLLDDAHRTRRVRLGGDHPDTLASANDVALLMRDLGEYQQSESLFRESLAHSRRVNGTRSEPTAQLIHGLALSLQSQARYDEAEALFQEAADILTSLNLDSSFAMAELLDAKGRLYEDLGRTTESIDTLRRAITLFKQVRGENHPSHLNAMQNLGYAYLSDGDPDQAETVLSDMLALSKKVYGNEHPFTIGCVATLATAYYYKGDYVLAESMYRDALERFEIIFGPVHTETAIGANNLASALHRLGRYQETEHYYRLGLERNLALYNGPHPEVATSYSNLGVFLLTEGDIDAAGEPIRLGLEMRRELLGDEHPNTVTSLSIYATYLSRIGSPESALEIMLEVIAFRREHLGEDHPHTAKEISHYGRLMREMGEFEEAREALSKSLAITRKVFKDGHMRIARIQIALAQTHAALGDQAEALATFNDAYAMMQKMIDPDHPEMATGLIAIGSFYNATGRLEEAYSMLAKAVQIREQHFGPTDWRHAQVHSAMGENMLRRGQCAPALDSLRQSYETLRSTRGERHRLTVEAFDRLSLPCPTSSGQS